jgi:hypothetical protein
MHDPLGLVNPRDQTNVEATPYQTLVAFHEEDCFPPHAESIQGPAQDIIADYRSLRRRASVVLIRS